MPRRFLSASVSFALLLVASVSLAADAPKERVYGAGVTNPDDVVPISRLLEEPEKYLDQTVRVSGPVVGVCKKRGCWIDLASDREFQKIQIKVEDGEIVFPPEIMGEQAICEGVFTGIPLTLEQTCSYLESEATCQGEKFDRQAITEPMTLYRIQGTGAIVRPAVAGKPAAAPAPADPAS